MKQKSFKHFFRLGMLFLMSAILLWNCELEEPPYLEEVQEIEKEYLTKRIPFSELPKNLSVYADQLRTRTVERGKRTNKANEVVIVDQSQVVMLVDSLGGTNYSINLKLSNQPMNKLYNLVVGVDSLGIEIDPYIMKYTIDNYEDIDMGEHLNLAEMIATIDIYQYESFLVYLENYFTNQHRNTDECPPHSISYGGEEIEDHNDPNGNGNEGDDEDTSDCQVDVWSNGENGDIFMINWHCSDGSSGSTEFRNQTEDCPGMNSTGTSGSSGINQGNGTCPEGMTADANGVCSCAANSYYAGTQGCVCSAGFVRNLAGDCINQCNTIRNMLADAVMQAKVSQLNGSVTINHETGFKQNFGSGFTNLPLITNNKLNLNGVSGYKGYMHSHVNAYTNSSGIRVNPVHMFSHADVKSFLVMVKSAIYNNNNIEEIYGIMVSSSGNYMLKFSGDPSSIPNTFNLVVLNRMYATIMARNSRVNYRERAFLKFIRDQMGIDGVNLYKINSSGLHQLKKLDSHDNLVSDNC